MTKSEKRMPVGPTDNMVQICECGCGLPTRTARSTDPRHGHVAGQPVRFRKGHSHRGKSVSDETRKKLSEAASLERSGQWKGDSAKYRALHVHVNKYFPRVGVCEKCGRTGKTEYALLKGREYSRNREDYSEMCPKCHRQYDVGGTVLSPEQRAKLSEAQQRRWRLVRERVAADCAEPVPEA